MAKVTIIIPVTFMPEWDKYLTRCLKSIEAQSFKDYEILMLKSGRAAETQNQLIKSAKGELIKILHQDDYFTSEVSLELIVTHFSSFDYWQASGCWHDDGSKIFYPHKARYSPDIHIGNNQIGAPSVLTFRNELGVYFDEDLDWLYDVSLYKKLFDKYGPPSYLDEFPVTIGLHQGQLTHQIPEDIKNKEVALMSKRYA